MIKKGNVYYCKKENMPQHGAYSTSKDRPVLVISQKVGNFYQVVPLTTRYNRSHNDGIMTVVNDCPAIILTEQIMSVTDKALDKYLDTIDEITMKKVEKAILNNFNIQSEEKAENRILKELIKKI